MTTYTKKKKKLNPIILISDFSLRNQLWNISVKKEKKV